jgi:FkbM family methyltransferase
MLCAKTTGVPSIVKLRPPQIAHPVFLRTGTTDVPMYHQVFTSRQYRVALSRLPRTILDCGGNVGFAAIYLANVYPGARILSIEPELSNYRLLAKNVAAYPDILPVHAAVWRSNTILDLSDEGGGACSFKTQEAGVGGQGRFIGRTVGLTIDTIINLADMDEIDFLNFDVEGAEHDIFFDLGVWLDLVNVLVIKIFYNKRIVYN